MVRSSWGSGYVRANGRRAVAWTCAIRFLETPERGDGRTAEEARIERGETLSRAENPWFGIRRLPRKSSSSSGRESRSSPNQSRRATARKSAHSDGIRVLGAAALVARDGQPTVDFASALKAHRQLNASEVAAGRAVGRA